jgi:hypothetical protein
LKSKKKRGPSKKDLEMFKLFMKSFDDSDTDEDDGSSFSISFHDPALFGHDPFTSQDPLPCLEYNPGLDDL